MLDILKGIFYFITSVVFIFWMKIIFIIVSAVLLVAIILLLLKTNWLKELFLEDSVELFTKRPYGIKKTFKQWAKIAKRMEIGKESEYKLAITDADVLLKDILIEVGFKGENMREVLEKVDSKILPNIKDVWSAHDIRNKMVHDPDYEITPDMAKKIMRIYEQSFRDLEMF
jgi:hypothetical protein